MCSIFIKRFGIVLFLFSSVSYADIGSKVSSWFDHMDYANVTSPGVYEGQTARYATLGGISTRAPVRDINLFSIQTPKISAGCGGIDIYSGGFSYIDADQFVDNLRNIGENAESVAFMLAIQIVTPQLAGIMEDINTFAQKANAMSMNSCEAATALVGGAFSYFSEKQANCITKRMDENGEDWTAANHACTTGARLRETEEQGGEPNVGAFTRGNLAWMVLMKDPFFSTDLDFAEVMMNFTGTIIREFTGSESDDPDDTVVFDSVVDEEGSFTELGENIYTALIHGQDSSSSFKIRKCEIERSSDPQGCTRISTEYQEIPKNFESSVKPRR